MFFPLYALSFLLIFSSQSFLSVWLGLELNMLTYVILLSHSSSKTPSSVPLQYFLIQTISSGIFFMALIINWTSPSEVGNYLLTMSLIMKTGGAPFHSWYISLMKTLNYWQLWSLSTIQKLGPLWVMSYLPECWQYFELVATPSLIISVFLVMTNFHFVALLMYSSLFNLGMMLFLVSNLGHLTIYFILYSTSLWFFVSTIPSYMDTEFLNHNYHPSSMWQGMSFCILLMNLSGVPPFFNMWGKISLFTYILWKKAFVKLLAVMIPSGMYIYIYFRSGFFRIMENEAVSIANPTTGVMSQTYFFMVISLSLMGVYF